MSLGFAHIVGRGHDLDHARPFEAIAATLPFASRFERELGVNSERWIWLERFWRVSWSG